MRRAKIAVQARKKAAEKLHRDLKAARKARRVARRESQ